LFQNVLCYCFLWNIPITAEDKLGLLLDGTSEQCFNDLLERVRIEERGKEMQRKKDMGNEGKEKYKIYRATGLKL
jgi:hypothetical protein